MRDLKGELAEIVGDYDYVTIPENFLRTDETPGNAPLTTCCICGREFAIPPGIKVKHTMVCSCVDCIMKFNSVVASKKNRKRYGTKPIMMNDGTVIK